LPKRRSFSKLLTWCWVFILTLLVNDMEANASFHTPHFSFDKFTALPDSIVVTDTIIPATKKFDSIAVPRKQQTSVDAKVERFASDSIVQDIINRKVFLYGDAEIKYEDITLKAAVIEVDFKTNTVFAYGIEDSTGKLTGNPEFTEGKQTFKAKRMSYNFTTKKGIIQQVLTEDDQGFLHGKKVKKMDDNTINVLHGSYTTCNLEENPHFAFKFKKARVIPDNKIVTGPAYMEIEGVPTILALPFGIFPNKAGQKSGIVIPSYGESKDRGFFLENGGYYWAINDHMDLTVLGDIYSRGSWAIKPSFRYKKRYKFNGYFNLGFAENIVGVKDAPDYSKSSDFRIRWVFSQDPKARPHSRFSADVNIVTSNYVKYNVVSTNDYLSNTFQSSIAYQTSFGAGKYNLTVNSTFSQNTLTHKVDVTLPQLTFSVNRFYPLRKAGGKKKFYEDLQLSYSMNARNQINTFDSLLFEPNVFRDDMKNGAIHKIPISLPVKVLKYFTLSNSINITDRMYSQTSRLNWSDDTLFINNDTLVGYVKADTVLGFRNAIDFSISSTLTTRVYGMLRFTKGPLKAIRHVFTPSVGISYTPDFGNESLGYYKSYTNGEGNEVEYSIFQNAYFKSIYGTPPGQKSGRVNFNFANNLEIKVRSRKDTITGMKKIKLIEALNISGSYDLAKDSLKMSFLNVTGRTTLYKNVTLQYASIWDPYALNTEGQRINKSEWEVNRRLFRLMNTSWNLSIGIKLGDKDFKKKEKPKEATQEQMDEIINNMDDYVDWSIPWSLDLRYNFAYRANITYLYYEKKRTDKIVQTLALRGQINITPKWKFTFTTGWDFTNNAISYTSINIYRDLHCWEMRFNWIPLGPRQSWNFSINVKASILQDLKLNRKKDFRDI
jgi:lipopolysaccharide assembly outer membrane protein LptD (OstA)